jgi:alanine racemase
MTTCTSSRALAEVDAAAFISNLKLAASLHSGDWLLPVIKANGYGHGLETLALALRGCADVPLTGVAVASLAEARQLC